MDNYVVIYGIPNPMFIFTTILSMSGTYVFIGACVTSNCHKRRT